MRIRVGSKNPVKVLAVSEITEEYPFLKDSEVFSCRLASAVSEQPKSLQETVIGAISRAKRAQKGFDLGFGIESGLMEVPGTKTGFMDVCVCAISDGNNFHLGLSSAFECPPEAVKMVLSHKMDLNEALFKIGFTKKKKVGSEEGGIGILTKGRVLRIDYTKQALRMALIHLENPEIYG